jgi:hypothetical protein
VNKTVTIGSIERNQMIPGIRLHTHKDDEFKRADDLNWNFTQLANSIERDVDGKIQNIDIPTDYQPKAPANNLYLGKDGSWQIYTPVDISGKVDKDQGQENAGKILGIDEDGLVYPQVLPSPSLLTGSATAWGLTLQCRRWDRLVSLTLSGTTTSSFANGATLINIPSGFRPLLSRYMINCEYTPDTWGACEISTAGDIRNTIGTSIPYNRSFYFSDTYLCEAVLPT